MENTTSSSDLAMARECMRAAVVRNPGAAPRVVAKDARELYRQHTGKDWPYADCPEPPGPPQKSVNDLLFEPISA